MGNCKCCIHNDVCLNYAITIGIGGIAVSDIENGEYCCSFFKDKSKLIELPCNEGDIVYESVRGQISEFVVDSFGFDGEKVWLNLKCIKGFVSRNVVGVNDIGKSVFLSKIEAEKSSGFCKPTFTI